jgi:hypothetical protein
MADKEKVRAHCNSCLAETWHEIPAFHSQPGREYLDEEQCQSLDWENRYEILVCRGCESVCLKHTYWFSEADGEKVLYYPPPVSRLLPAWVEHLPKDQVALIGEIYVALQSDSAALSLMGVRALLDMAMLDKVGDRGTFVKKLDALELSGLLARKQRTFLEAVLDAGNAAAHRGHRPSSDDLNASMDIVEHLLQAAYVLPSAASRVKENTPPRPTKK